MAKERKERESKERKLKTLSSKSFKNKNKKKIGNPNKKKYKENKTKEKIENKDCTDQNKNTESDVSFISTLPADQQLRFLLQSFQIATKTKLSPLELDAYNESCMVELEGGTNQSVENLSEHVKKAFGTEWRESLCKGNIPESETDIGSPSLLVISTSALRSLELLRGLKQFTKECRPVKLFAKHMKVEEQVTLLKARVNIACGTPSRIKKLIDIDALSLSCLTVVILDMQRDAKAFSLFTLPQVSGEFWDLYKSHLEERVLRGETRICFYGSVPNKQINKAFQSNE